MWHMFDGISWHMVYGCWHMLEAHGLRYILATWLTSVMVPLYLVWYIPWLL
jgi:hypothetical protein